MGRMKAALAPLMSSENMSWNTPGEILSLVRKVDLIGLDPATDETNPTLATRFFTPEDNGLKQDWCGYGLVYVNPPYGREIGDWVRWARRWGLGGVEVIMLVPARPDTAWWQDNVPGATVCFWRGRVRFVGADNGAPFPSALIYWGHRKDRFREVFEESGWVVTS